MTTAIFIFVVILFLLLGAAAIVSIVFGAPGTWIILFLALIIEISDGLWRDPLDPGGSFTLWIMIACALLALAGEIIEFLSGLWGAKLGGSTKRGMWGALVGGVVGVIAGTFLIPIPVVGSLAGALIGTFAGAFILELGNPALRTHQALRPAIGATLGRIAGTVIKIPVGITVFAVLAIDLIVSGL